MANDAWLHSLKHLEGLLSQLDTLGVNPRQVEEALNWNWTPKPLFSEIPQARFRSYDAYRAYRSLQAFTTDERNKPQLVCVSMNLKTRQHIHQAIMGGLGGDLAQDIHPESESLSVFGIKFDLDQSLAPYEVALKRRER